MLMSLEEDIQNQPPRGDWKVVLGGPGDTLRQGGGSTQPPRASEQLLRISQWEAGYQLGINYWGAVKPGEMYPYIISYSIE